MKDIESIIEDIYGNGWYHWIYVILVSLTGFICMSEIVSEGFMMYSPDIICSDPFTNITDPSSICVGSEILNNTQQCLNWTYSTEVMSRTLVTDNNLNCGKDNLKPLLNSGYLLFTGLGYLLSMIGDTVGRKPVFLALTGLELFSLIACLFSSNYYYMIAIRCLRGINAAFKHFGMACLTELLPIRKRPLMLTLWWMPWTLGAAFTGLGAYLTRNWFHLRIIMLIPSIPYLVFFFLQMESPRWLLLQDRKDEAIAVFKRIARWNKAKVDQEYFESLSMLNYNSDIALSGSTMNEISMKIQNKETLLDAFRNKTICIRLFIIIFCGSFVNFSYYGLLTQSNFLNANIFLNSLLISAMEIPALVCMFILLKLFGSKSASVLSILATAACIFTCDYLIPWPIAKYTVANLGKVMSCCALSVFNVYILECMPTSIRSSVLLLEITIGSALSSLSPFLNNLSGRYLYLKGGTYSVTLILGALLLGAFMPNTFHCPLSQTIEEASKLKKGKEKEWCDQMRTNVIEVKL